MKPKSRFLGSFRYWAPDWTGILMLLFWFVVGVLAANILTLLLALQLGQDFVDSYGMLISYPVMFLPAFIFALLKSRSSEMQLFVAPEPLDVNNFSPVGAGLCAVLVMVATLACGFMTDIITRFLPPIPDNLAKIFSELTGGNFWLNFLCVSIMAPFFEEWLCRGMILRGLLHKGLHPGLAIAISALFFGLIHLNPWQAIPAIILGSLFGYVYYKTGSLKLSMLMHFTNNTLALVCGQIPQLTGFDSYYDMLGLVWYLVGFMISMVLLLVFFVVIGKIPAAFESN